MNDQSPFTKTSSVPLDRLRKNGGTQTRHKIHPSIVADYAAVLEAEKDLPPVIAFDDGTNLWLVDGFHRWYAHRDAGRKTIPCLIYQGSCDDALEFALGANHDHGLRRSRHDKERAVKMALKHKRWKDASDRVIAELCHVSSYLVELMRSTVGSDSSTRVGADGKRRKVSSVLCDKCARGPIVKPCIYCQEARRKAKEARKAEKRAAKASRGEGQPFDPARLTERLNPLLEARAGLVAVCPAIVDDLNYQAMLRLMGELDVILEKLQKQLTKQEK